MHLSFRESTILIDVATANLPAQKNADGQTDRQLQALYGRFKDQAWESFEILHAHEQLAAKKLSRL